jgi:hypothetical protein
MKNSYTNKVGLAPADTSGIGKAPGLTFAKSVFGGGAKMPFVLLILQKHRLEFIFKGYPTLK